ncbi:KdsC family phosphatase [Wansuia hejianensis]|nr:3-deoxy-D-manno-octulosonate 8-phosphate phosphatase [Wansuia hejianensis]
MDKKKTKYLVMDVDGTLTDGKIYMGNSGEMMKAFNIKDGCGIHDILLPAGIIPIIITGRQSDIVINRCREIGITDIYQGINNKLEKLNNISSDLSCVAYIGDDINDLSCMRSIKSAGGLIGCPKNAVKQVLDLVDYISDYDGGDGAVRDFIEWICYGFS